MIARTHARIHARTHARTNTHTYSHTYTCAQRGFSLAFAGFWLAQAVWVWVGSLPMLLLNGSCDADPPFGLLDVVGSSVFLILSPQNPN